MKNPRTTHLTPGWKIVLRLGSFILPVAIVLGLSGAQAQDAGAAPAKFQLPSGALLESAPAFSEWTVTYSYPEDRAPKGTASPPTDSRPRTIKTTKTRDVIHEVTVDLQGTKMDLWIMHGVQYSKDPNSGTWYQSEAGVNGFTPFPANGFRDLSGISPENYAGTIKYSGHYCLVFVPGGASTLDLSKPDAQVRISSLAPSATVAFIDLETRLPVEVRTSGTIRYYQFADPPSAMLTPAPDLAQQLQKGAEAEARLAQPAGRPY